MGILLLTVWASRAVGWTLPWFGVSFSEYTPGETLSDSGAAGGGWEALSASVTATNAPADGLAAIALASGSALPQAVFAASAPAGQDLWTVEANLFPEEPRDFGVGEIDGPVAITFVAGEGGALAPAAVMDGAWHRLSAPGVTFAPGVWRRVRITAREIDGARYVGFAVVDGGVAVPLRSDTGAEWFAADAARLAAIGSAAFVGDGGRFSDFTAVREQAGSEPVAMDWVGGASGDWDAPGGWSGERAPAPGETVRVAGPATLAYGGGAAEVRNALFRVKPDGSPELVAGDLRTEVEADFGRVVPGRALTVAARPFAGVTPPLDVRWRMGRTVGAKDYALAATGPSFTPRAEDLEHWLRCETTDGFGEVRTREVFLSRLPVLYLTTDDGKTPSAKKEEHDGRVFAQGNADWPMQYDGKMTIKVRGNSTSGHDKKPWKLKLKDKTKMFGIDKSKHWVLLANWYDESMMRNRLAYDFANEIGSKGMRSTWVECVLNGAWQGCYLFCEHIRIDKNRVNVFNWEDEAEERGIDGGDEDFSWVGADEDVSGGYIFEFDSYYDEMSKFTVTAGNLVLKTMINSPEFLCTNQRMMDWCQGFIRNYASAITSPDGYSKEGLPCSAYCDIGSMADYFLVEEMFGNEDARARSNYAYKERGEPMRFGPVWDFDWGVGNYQLPYAPESWLCNYGEESFYREWADDPWFCTLLWTRYHRSARAKFAEIVREGGVLDRHYAALREAGEANDVLWKHHYGFKGGVYGTGSHPGLRQYLRTRLAWLDRQFRDVPTLMASLKAGTRTTPSTRPYDRTTDVLPVAFANAPQGGLWEGQDLRLAFRVGGGVAKVGVYANGIRVGEPVAPEGRRLDVTIPSAMLTAAKGDPNCVSLVAFDSSSKAVARNYALVTLTEWDDERDATAPTTDASGATVPSVPYRWIRDAAAGKVPSLATATEEGEFAAVVTATPSPWGKATPLWRDYVAGTDPDPSGSNATFRITKFELVDGVPRITYAPDLKEKRTYTTFGKERLDDPEEDWRSPAPAGARFFRVEVSLPTGL